MSAHQLSIAISAAVPLWIEQLRGLSWEVIERRARECARVAAEKGDIIQYRSTRRGEPAAAFNALAQGLACLAFQPGGVKAFGQH